MALKPSIFDEIKKPLSGAAFLCVAIAPAARHLREWNISTQMQFIEQGIFDTAVAVMHDC
ncbi:MAG: hypothetical protein BGP05_11115 [Rhizobiales bacterium 62-47]|nr:MAG: hypothetical protein BGP05_11115 [Rhizobiales bacterium 62-47]